MFFGGELLVALGGETDYHKSRSIDTGGFMRLGFRCFRRIRDNSECTFGVLFYLGRIAL